MRKGIHVSGSILVDLINEIPAYPARGELTKILQVKKSCGGLVSNVAIDLKRIAPSLDVSAGGKIGDDDNGRFVLEVLRGEGIDVDAIVVSPSGITSFTNVISERSGERTFFNYPGESAGFGLDDIPFGKLDCRMFHLGYFLLLDRIDAGDGEVILQKLQSLGIRTSIDLVTEKSDRYALVRPCLKYVDNIIINETEASRLAGIAYDGSNIERIMRTLRDFGVRERVIVHMPDRGCLLSDRGFIELPSLDLPKEYIKGTTGAGDAYCAGALYSIHEGRDDWQILQFASKAAAMSLSSMDATGAMCSEKEIEEHFKNIGRKC